MHTIRFSTFEPYDALLRALDILRKMGFRLLGLNVSQSAPLNTMELQFEVCGNLPAHTFVERLRLHDILDLTVVDADEAMPGRRDFIPAELRSVSWTSL